MKHPILAIYCLLVLTFFSCAKQDDIGTPADPGSLSQLKFEFPEKDPTAYGNELLMGGWELKSVDGSKETISITIPFSADVTKAKVTGTISPGAKSSITLPATMDLTSSKSITVTSAGGKTSEYVFSVDKVKEASSKKLISSFSFETVVYKCGDKLNSLVDTKKDSVIVYTATIEQEKIGNTENMTGTVVVNVPLGTPLDKINTRIVLEDNQYTQTSLPVIEVTSDNRTATENNEDNKDKTYFTLGVLNMTTSKQIKITAQDETTIDYDISVVPKGLSDVTLLELTAVVETKNFPATITGDQLVSLVLPKNTDLASLKFEAKLPDCATSNINFEEENDYSTPRTLRITAEDGTTKEYTINVVTEQ